jgi:hypothetical protein
VRFHKRRVDAALASFPALDNVTTVDRQRSDVTDNGLKELVKFKGMEFLRLADCKGVTGAGLAELGAIDKLFTVELVRSGATDKGLKGLAALKELTSLDVADTAVTDGGVRVIAGFTKLQILGLIPNSIDL